MVAPESAAWRRLALRARHIDGRDRRLRRDILVIAPHPDDESLGVGGLLALRVGAGHCDHVAFLTDGAGSHRAVPGWTPGRVGRARAGEGRAALRALGMPAAPLFLGWADAAPVAADTRLFRVSAARLIALCRRHRIGAVLTTWAGEPHCDHEAAAALGQAVAQACRTARLDYLVWGWTRPDLATACAGWHALSLDVAPGRARQRRAIACHRSQRGGRITGGGTCFRLPRDILQLAARPRLILLDEDYQHAA